MSILAEPEQHKEIELLKCRSGTKLMKAAGLRNSRVIPNLDCLPVNFAYYGAVKRADKNVRALIYVRNRNSFGGRKTSEIALVDGSNFRKGDIVYVDTNAIRFLEAQEEKLPEIIVEVSRSRSIEKTIDVARSKSESDILGNEKGSEKSVEASRSDSDKNQSIF
eukprot:UN06714